MILQLKLKRKWFDLIAKGEKVEEYREIKDYWARRLWLGYSDSSTLDQKESLFRLNQAKKTPEFKPFTHVRFQNGYSKNAPFITFEVREICISEGVPGWGATPGERYFVIKLGERIL